MPVRLIIGLFIISAALSQAASAEEASDVRFSAKELQNIFLFCDVAHRPGPRMMPCLNDQLEKMKLAKETQRNNERMEAVTRQQIQGGSAADPDR